MSKTQKIKAFYHYDKGWEWEFTGGEKYRTNSEGEGLWHMQKSGAWYSNGKPVFEYRQILGTGQFSLSSSRAAAQRKVRRQFLFLPTVTSEGK